METGSERDGVSTKSVLSSSRSTRSVNANAFLASSERRDIALTVLYNIPKPRQEWISGKFVQRHEKNEEAWVELMLDLVYVVLLSKLGSLLETCHHSVFTYFKVSVLFWIMCMSRQAIDEYANRFYVHDLAHKLLYFVFSCGIFVQIMNINTSSAAYKEEHGTEHSCHYESAFGSGIAVGVLITRLSLLSSKRSLFICRLSCTTVTLIVNVCVQFMRQLCIISR
jgi:hypothetical protein